MSFSKKYTTSLLQQILQADVVGAASTAISHLLTDSRRLIYPEETLFFALKTSTNNGHLFINDLLRKGVKYFVVDNTYQPQPQIGVVYFVVDDVLVALQKLATYHRKLFKKPVITITGSNGKTVVKEWLFQVLNKKFNIIRSPRSYNSQIGVPLSLWQLDEAHNLAIIEAGVSTYNEMQKLRQMIEPDFGIFTNIGSAHSEGFDTIQQKANEKASLFILAKKVVYCADYKEVEYALHEHLRLSKDKLLSWSFKKGKAPIFVEVKDGNIIIHYKNGNTLQVLSPFVESGWIENIIHISILAKELGLSDEDISASVAQLQPVSMRMEERNGINGNLLINDFYNSDPESVRLALEHLMQQPAERPKVVVISAFEGLSQAQKKSAYQKLVALLNTQLIAEVVGIGAELEMHFENLRMPHHVFSSTEDFLSSDIHKHWRNTAILLKGARNFGFERIADTWQAQIHQTWLEIDLGAMAHNLRYYRSTIAPTTKIMAMVKALSYGAGTTEIARVLQYNKVDYLAVAYADEGILLRQNGISLPILVMNPDAQAFARMIEFNLEPELYSVDRVKEFLEIVKHEYQGAERFPIHLKIETGMNRLGIDWADIAHVAELLQANKQVKVASIFSHLAASDNPRHDDFTQQQIDKFTAVCAVFAKALGYNPLMHLANTAAISRHPGAQFNMVRLGIGLYGIGESNTTQSHLKRVTRWLTRVSQVKQVQTNESVGYNRAFVATKPTTIATLPVGYADGMFRVLGEGRGSVFVAGAVCKIIGKVCMDMLMVDVTNLQVQPGDVVELMGENITAEAMADAAATIPYELLTHISTRVPRVYITE